MGCVYRDEIVLWIMNSSEVLENPLYSKGQHRGNKGNEGQLHIKDDNVHLLNKYVLKGDAIEKAIKNAAHSHSCNCGLDEKPKG